MHHFAHHGEQIDLVIIDLIMPRMSGVACLEALRNLAPAVKAIACSGCSPVGRMDHLRAHGFRAYIKKPFVITELGEVVEGVLFGTSNWDCR